MPVFFIPPENFLPDKAIITGPDVRHITRVLRLGKGDRIKVCDNQGKKYLARIEVTDKGRIIAALESGVLLEKTRDHQIRFAHYMLRQPIIIIGQAIPKGYYKMDLIVQKSSELGASKLVPLLTQRTLVRLNPKTTGLKIARWQKIAQEAAKQSGSRKILRVDNLASLDEFCSFYATADLKLIFWEEESVRYLKDTLPKETLPGTIALIIGPEGGFARQEIEQAQHYGFLPTGLGPRILRVETVALALLTILQYQYGDLG